MSYAIKYIKVKTGTEFRNEVHIVVSRVKFDEAKQSGFVTKNNFFTVLRRNEIFLKYLIIKRFGK